MKWAIWALTLMAALVLSACDDEDDEPAASVDEEAVEEDIDGSEVGEPAEEEEVEEVVVEEEDDLPDEVDEEPIEEEDDLPDELDEADQKRIFADTFDGLRNDLIDDLETGRDVDTVDRIEYLNEDETFVLSVTSGWASDDRQRDAAWGIARHLAQFWSDDFWHNITREPEWNPVFDLTVDSHNYSCAGEAMSDLADRRLDRNGWEQTCN